MGRWRIAWGHFWINYLRYSLRLSFWHNDFFRVSCDHAAYVMRMIRARFIKNSMSMSIILASLSLLGCWGGGLPTDLIKQPKKVPGTADSRAVVLQKKLINNGVQVISIGQDYLVSIPSSLLFPDQSPQLTWQSYDLLNRVIAYLKQYRKIAVNVTAYSSQYGSTRREDALTLARAKVISRYLWSQGIDSRFIFAEGAGREKPISSYLAGGDQSLNSRIEITFRDAII